MDQKSIPKFAVLLAAYNGVEWIEEQIETILKQADVVVNIYVSLDLSTDGTLEILEKYDSIEPRVRLLEYGKKYGGAAKNFFRLIRDVDFSNYDYVALADQDDVWLPDKLSFAANIIKSRGLDAYSSDVLAFWNDSRTKLLIKKSHPKKKLDFLFESAGPGCTYVFNVTAFVQFKKFLIVRWDCANKVELHDWLIYAYFRANKFRWLIDSVPLINYRQHASNQVGVNQGFKAYLGRINKVREKWYRGEVEKIALLLGLQVPKRSFMILNFLQIRRRTRDAFVLMTLVILGLY